MQVKKPRQRTDVPVVIGSWISNTMIRAVKTVANGTTSDGGHRTLPMLRWIGSMQVRYSVALVPAAAQGTLFSSTSITALGQQPTHESIGRLELTSYKPRFIPWKYSKTLSDLYDAPTYTTGHTRPGSLSLEDIGDRQP